MFSLNFRQPTVTPSGRFEWQRHPVSAMCPETNYLKCVICRLPLAV